MTIRVVFGMTAPTLDDACAAVEKALGVAMKPHYSLHKGGDYWRFEQGDLLLVLQDNIDALDDEPAELEFPKVPFILYVDGVTDESRSCQAA